MQKIEVKTEFNAEMEILQTAMSQMATRICMANPDYRELHGRFMLLKRFHDEKIKEGKEHELD